MYINHGEKVPYSLHASGSNLGALAIIMNFFTLVYNILLSTFAFKVALYLPLRLKCYLAF
jgi:hypothetical protein